MVTTIQISDELQQILSKRKLYDRQTYEEVILDLVEDSMEISEETKKELAEARAEVKAGKVHKLSDIKKGLGL